MIIVHEMFCTVIKYLYELHVQVCAVWPAIRRHTQRWELHQRFILTNLENDTGITTKESYNHQIIISSNMWPTRMNMRAIGNIL